MKNSNEQTNLTIKDLRNHTMMAGDALTVEGLRQLLSNVGDQGAKVHTVSEEKYGEIITTKSVTGLRFELDANGQQHIIITTK